MNESILLTIKKLLGLTEDYAPFDEDIKVFINSALSTLFQIGGIKHPLKITGANECWHQVMGTRTDLELVKSYIYLKVRMTFDPPQTGGVLNAYTEQIKELEWRINTLAESELPR